MHKKIHLIVITLLLILNFGCSSNSDSVDDIIEQPEINQINVFSFSKEFAYVNEEVSILGENFTIDKSQVEISFDDKSVEIVSINENKIVIKIPEGTSLLPNLNITIPNATIEYDNTFEKIAILDNTLNKWIEIEHSFSSINKIRNFNAVDKEKIYFSLQETINSSFDVKKAFNGGALIKPFDQSYGFFDFKGAFFLGEKGGEYSLRLNSLYHKNIEGESELLNEFSQNSSWNFGLFVDSSETNIILASTEGKVYESNDSGNTFTTVHENDPQRYEFEAFYAYSPTQIWLGGYTYPFDDNLSYYPAKMLYLKEDGNWYNKTVNIEIKDGNREIIQKIHFIDGITGFAIAKINDFTIADGDEKYVIIKSETKGDTWSIVHENNQEIKDFTFKDKNTGWFISGNEIFKTTDGGASWNIEYTNDTESKGILYNQDILWVIASDKILKKYF